MKFISLDPPLLNMFTSRADKYIYGDTWFDGREIDLRGSCQKDNDLYLWCNNSASGSTLIEKAANRVPGDFRSFNFS